MTLSRWMLCPLVALDLKCGSFLQNYVKHIETSWWSRLCQMDVTTHLLAIAIKTTFHSFSLTDYLCELYFSSDITSTLLTMSCLCSLTYRCGTRFWSFLWRYWEVNSCCWRTIWFCTMFLSCLSRVLKWCPIPQYLRNLQNSACLEHICQIGNNSHLLHFTKNKKIRKKNRVSRICRKCITENRTWLSFPLVYRIFQPAAHCFLPLLTMT